MKRRHIVLTVVSLLLLAATWGVMAAMGVTVEKAVVCKGVENREPAGESASFSSDVGQVYCWSKIITPSNTTIRHKYYYKEIETTTIELAVSSPTHRTWSVKRIPSGSTGPWRVDILDAENTVLKSVSFSVTEKL